MAGVSFEKSGISGTDAEQNFIRNGSNPRTTISDPYKSLISPNTYNPVGPHPLPHNTMRDGGSMTDMPQQSSFAHPRQVPAILVDETSIAFAQTQLQAGFAISTNKERGAYAADLKNYLQTRQDLQKSALTHAVDKLSGGTVTNEMYSNVVERIHNVFGEDSPVGQRLLKLVVPLAHADLNHARSSPYPGPTAATAKELGIPETALKALTEAAERTDFHTIRQYICEQIRTAAETKFSENTREIQQLPEKTVEQLKQIHEKSLQKDLNYLQGVAQRVDSNIILETEALQNLINNKFGHVNPNAPVESISFGSRIPTDLSKKDQQAQIAETLEKVSYSLALSQHGQINGTRKVIENEASYASLQARAFGIKRILNDYRNSDQRDFQKLATELAGAYRGLTSAQIKELNNEYRSAINNGSSRGDPIDDFYAIVKNDGKISSSHIKLAQNIMLGISTEEVASQIFNNSNKGMITSAMLSLDPKSESKILWSLLTENQRFEVITHLDQRLKDSEISTANKVVRGALGLGMAAGLAFNATGKAAEGLSLAKGAWRSKDGLRKVLNSDTASAVGKGLGAAAYGGGAVIAAKWGLDSSQYDSGLELLTRHIGPDALRSAPAERHASMLGLNGQPSYRDVLSVDRSPISHIMDQVKEQISDVTLTPEKRGHNIVEIMRTIPSLSHRQALLMMHPEMIDAISTAVDPASARTVITDLAGKTSIDTAALHSAISSHNPKAVEKLLEPLCLHGAGSVQALALNRVYELTYKTSLNSALQNLPYADPHDAVTVPLLAHGVKAELTSKMLLEGDLSGSEFHSQVEYIRGVGSGKLATNFAMLVTQQVQAKSKDAHQLLGLNQDGVLEQLYGEKLALSTKSHVYGLKDTLDSHQGVNNIDRELGASLRKLDQEVKAREEGIKRLNPASAAAFEQNLELSTFKTMVPTLFQLVNEQVSLNDAISKSINSADFIKRNKGVLDGFGITIDSSVAEERTKVDKELKKADVDPAAIAKSLDKGKYSLEQLERDHEKLNAAGHPDLAAALTARVVANYNNLQPTGDIWKAFKVKSAEEGVRLVVALQGQDYAARFVENQSFFNETLKNPDPKVRDPQLIAALENIAAPQTFNQIYEMQEGKTVKAQLQANIDRKSDFYTVNREVLNRFDLDIPQTSAAPATTAEPVSSAPVYQRSWGLPPSMPYYQPYFVPAPTSRPKSLDQVRAAANKEPVGE